MSLALTILAAKGLGMVAGLVIVGIKAARIARNPWL
jgi:hypothetical protein